MSNENVKNFQTKNTLRNICFSPQGRPRDNNFVRCEFNDDYLLCCISLSLFLERKLLNFCGILSKDLLLVLLSLLLS